MTCPRLCCVIFMAFLMVSVLWIKNRKKKKHETILAHQSWMSNWLGHFALWTTFFHMSHHFCRASFYSLAAHLSAVCPLKTHFHLVRHPPAVVAVVLPRGSFRGKTLQLIWSSMDRCIYIVFDVVIKTRVVVCQGFKHIVSCGLRCGIYFKSGGFLTFFSSPARMTFR